MMLILKMCPEIWGEFWTIAELSVCKEIYGDNFCYKGNYMYQNHNIELGGDLGIIKLIILTFQGKNDSKIYLE